MLDTGLERRVVLVTGGSGGIGRAVSRAFAAQGALVAVHFHGAEVATSDGRRWEHESPSAEAAHAFASELGQGFAVEADLSDRDAAQRLLDAVEDRLGPVDVVVNNAAHRCGSPSVICR